MMPMMNANAASFEPGWQFRSPATPFHFPPMPFANHISPLPMMSLPFVSRAMYPCVQDPTHTAHVQELHRQLQTSQAYVLRLEAENKDLKEKVETLKAGDKKFRRSISDKRYESKRGALKTRKRDIHSDLTPFMDEGQPKFVVEMAIALFANTANLQRKGREGALLHFVHVSLA
jgi:hypothetical protein